VIGKLAGTAISGSGSSSARFCHPPFRSSTTVRWRFSVREVERSDGRDCQTFSGQLALAISQSSSPVPSIEMIFVGRTFDCFACDMGFPPRPKVDILEPSQGIRRKTCFRSERQVAYKISGLLEGKGPDK